MITGSAPISAEVLKFFKVSLQINIFEVYGQTECLGVCTSTKLDDFNGGTVGGIVPTMKVKTRDIPEMGYSAKDKEGCRGELMISGINIFRGYFQNEEKTRETLLYDTEEDRRNGVNPWIATGDVVCIDREYGTVKIVDRAKNIFKLS